MSNWRKPWTSSPDEFRLAAAQFRSHVIGRERIEQSPESRKTPMWSWQSSWPSSWQEAVAWPDFAALGRRMAADESELRRKLWRKVKCEVASVPFLEDMLTAHYCAFDR